MKLKMIKGPRPGQKDMVCMTDHGTFGANVGETIDVSDEAGHEILSKWGDCFEKDGGAVKAPSVKSKVVSNYDNKAVSSDKEVKAELSEEDKVVL